MQGPLNLGLNRMEGPTMEGPIMDWSLVTNAETTQRESVAASPPGPSVHSRSASDQGSVPAERQRQKLQISFAPFMTNLGRAAGPWHECLESGWVAHEHPGWPFWLK